MRGSHDCPMHRQPFTLMQIQVATAEGIRIWKPMWLIMVGQRRNELTITEAYQSYRQRYDERPQRGFLAMGTRER
nr:hypothetical protein [Myxosarcina sp. GI1]